MKAGLLKAAMIAAWIMLAVEIIILGLGFFSIAVGETVVSGGPTGLLVHCIGILRTAMYGVVPLAILLIVIRIYQRQGT